MSNTAETTRKKKFNVLSETEVGDDLDLLPDEYQAYRIDAQVRPSHALIDFCKSNGDHQAIAYNHLYDVKFNRSEGLILTFSEHLVHIKGHSLSELFRYLKRHRIIWIWEADEREERIADGKSPVVSEITINSRLENN